MSNVSLSAPGSSDFNLEGVNDLSQGSDIASIEEDVQCNFTPLFETESSKAWYIMLTLYIQILCAILIAIQFAFHSRNGDFIEACMHWKAAMPVPVNMTETRRDRGIIVAAFGLTTVLSTQIVLGFQVLPYKYGGQVRAIFILLECVLVGFIFWPIFAVITTRNLFGQIVGAIYIWAFLVSYVIFGIPCQSADNQKIVITLLTSLPIFIFVLWISIGILFRILSVFWSALRRRKLACKVAYRMDAMDYHVVHVKRVLNENKKAITIDKEGSTIKKLLDYIYTPIPGFRYSINILAAVAMTETIVFTVMMIIIDYYTRLVRNGPDYVSGTRTVLIETGLEHETMVAIEDTDVNVTVGQVMFPLLDFADFFLTYSKVPVYTSFALAFLISVICTLLTLKNYRRNLLGLYRGERNGLIRITDNPLFNLPPAEILAMSTKYVGYQVGYGTSAFIAQFVALAILLCLLWFAFIIVVVMGQWQYLLDVLRAIWPSVVFFLGAVIVQMVMCNFFFLQRAHGNQRHRPLALNNRHFYFNFQYFMVYVNAPLGILACIGRLFQSVTLGLWTASRLDMSTMSRSFEAADIGFVSYICLLTMENAQCNPTQNVFVQILLKSIENPRKFPPVSRRRRLVINRWNLLVTLTNNPKLIQLRSESLLLKNFNGYIAGKAKEEEISQTIIERY